MYVDALDSKKNKNVSFLIQQQLFFEDFSIQVQKNIWKIEAYFSASSFQLIWNLPKVKLDTHGLWTVRDFCFTLLFSLAAHPDC